MTSETFNKLLDELDGNSLETLKQKNAKYASPEDCLHNFDSGADIMGGTPAQCAVSGNHPDAPAGGESETSARFP